MYNSCINNNLTTLELHDPKMTLRSLIIYNIISVSRNFLVGSISHQKSSYYCMLDSIMYTLVVIISLIG